MINCPKCGADNLLNAIFCRTCGEKLNLDELKPTEVGPSEEDKKRLAQQKLMNQIGGGIIAVILAVVLGGILIPPGGKLKGAEPSADAMAKFEAGKCKP
ncbi:MAG: zinc-ribbon domain-containing protein, partial [Victivallales bacterium]|nr:zinc-ribbon domain-containing protein [Victivallales bacterium]